MRIRNAIYIAVLLTVERYKISVFHSSIQLCSFPLSAGTGSVITRESMHIPVWIHYIFFYVMMSKARYGTVGGGTVGGGVFCSGFWRLRDVLCTRAFGKTYGTGRLSTRRRTRCPTYSLFGPINTKRTPSNNLASTHS